MWGSQLVGLPWRLLGLHAAVQQRPAKGSSALWGLLVRPIQCPAHKQRTFKEDSHFSIPQRPYHRTQGSMQGRLKPGG